MNCKPRLFESKHTVNAAIALFFISACFHNWHAYAVSDEYGHFAAGIAWWQLQNTHLFNVNPPLIRVVATLPAYVMGFRVDESTDLLDSNFRPEFEMGRSLHNESPARFILALRLGRLLVILINTCLFAILASLVDQLYGRVVASFAIIACVFQPQILSHGSTILCDLPAAIMIACFAIHLKLQMVNYTNSRLWRIGLWLGLCSITKFTAISLWPICICFLTLNRLRSKRKLDVANSTLDLTMIAVAIVAALCIVAFPYYFEGLFRAVGECQFVSRTLGGNAASLSRPANLLTGSKLALLRLPVPIDYLQGIDRQLYDFDNGLISYAAGVCRQRGWWWFFPYSMLVKLPVGSVLLILFATIQAIIRSWRSTRGLYQALFRHMTSPISLCFALMVYCLITMTGFSQQHRYVLLIYPLLFVLVGVVFLNCGRSGQVILIVALIFSLVETASVAPNWMSYFNLASGGFENGPWHLVNDAADWGQDLQRVLAYIELHPNVDCILISANDEGCARALGIDTAISQIFKEGKGARSITYIISTTDLAYFEDVRRFAYGKAKVGSIFGSYVIFK